MERVIRIVIGFLLAIPLVIDLFGTGTAWQYLYNAVYILCILPLLIAVPFRKNKYEKEL